MSFYESWNAKSEERSFLDLFNTFYLDSEYIYDINKIIEE